MATPQTEVLITVAGTERGRFLCEPGEYILGRNADCHIPVEADLVSRRHAKLTINFDHAFIEDLGSSNGTLVNGKPVTGNTRLWPNQKIQIGAATIELRRIKVEFTPDMTVTPAGEVLRRVLPKEFLREKKYDIGDLVAKGGMGAILRAKEATTDRTVAMKVMLDTNDADALARFLNEARITAQLEHPNIVPVHELSRDENGQVFYTMKMVKGITLKKVLELLAEGVETTVKKYPLAALLTIFQKVCDAIAFAHSKGVIHRDLKPENIMLADYGEVLVMDWGLAKLLALDRAKAGAGPGVDLRSIVPTAPADGKTGSMTLAGTVMGTPTFMSPEQARGEVDELDARSDIYALGTILYQILSLRIPVTGKDAWEIVGKVGRGEIEPLDSQPGRQDAKENKNAASLASSRLGGHLPGGRIPESLAAVVRKAMAFEKTQRYARVPDLQKDIEAFQNGFATSAEKAGAWKQFTLLVRRNKAASVGAAAVLLVGSILGTKTILEGNRAERALGDLKNKAPALLKLADNEAVRQQFDSALENADTALTLDPAYLPAYWRRAWLLIGMERWNDAIHAIRLAREKDPAHGELAAILPIVEQLDQAPSNAERWNAGRSEPLLAHLRSVGASGEIVKLASVLFRNAEGRVQLVRQTLVDRLGKDANFEVKADSQGGITVSLRGMGKTLTTLDAVRGLPIDHLDITRTGVESLEPLLGMKLRSLFVFETTITDLRPVQGMPLRDLNVGDTKVRDFSPLRGAPLEKIELTRCLVADLSPLRGAPLSWVSMREVGAADLTFLTDSPVVHLFASSNPIRDVTALRGKPLEHLNLEGTNVADLTPLKGAPIEELLIFRTSGENFSPLLDLPKLRRLHVSVPKVQEPGFSVLRQHPTLELINDVKAAEFWAAYDAKPK